MPADPMLRASDENREQIVAELTRHVGTGRLALREFDERAAAAYAAETIGELQTLVSDLPAATAVASEADAPPAWLRWAGVALISIVIWLATSLSAGELLYFWPGWVVGPWALAMLLFRFTGRREACSWAIYRRRTCE